MLSFYLQQVSGHHTQRESLRQSSSTLHLKHILAGQIAVLVPSTRRWVLCSSSFLYLLAQTHLFKPSLVGSPLHLRRAMPKPVWASSEVPSSFVIPSIFSCSNSTRFDCIPPHPFFVLSSNPFLKPIVSTNPFHKSISQTHHSKPNSDEIYIFIYIYIYIYLWSFIFWSVGFHFLAISRNCFTLGAQMQETVFWKNAFTCTTKHWKYFSGVFPMTQNKHLKIFSVGAKHTKQYLNCATRQSKQQRFWSKRRSFTVNGVV